MKFHIQPDSSGGGNGKMASLAALRKQAKDMGIAPATIRAATTAEELQSVIEDHNAHDGGSKVVAKKKTHRKTAPARKTVAKKKTVARKSAVRKTTARKPVRNSARKTSTPARSRKSGTAKRSQATSGYVPKGGRNVLDAVEYGDFEGWNPRPGSPPDRIIKALKKFRGDRAKVFDFLSDDVWDFVGKVKRNGQKRTKAEALNMLAYRISRTAWDFAMRTGQHEAADNRVKYGTGGTGEGVWKPARKTGATRKTAGAKKTAARRKTGSKTRTAQRASGGRRKATTRRRKTAVRR